MAFLQKLTRLIKPSELPEQLGSLTTPFENGENSGNYIWNPDQQGWADEYEKFNIRMKNVAWGWYNAKERVFLTGIYTSTGVGRSRLYEPSFDTQDVDYFLNRYFNFVKNKFENEQNTVLL